MKKFILEFLRDEGGWLNFALMGAGALASYLSGRSKKQSDQTSESTSTSTTNPILDPEILSARNKLLQTYQDRLGNNEGYLTGYTGQGLRKINRASDLQQSALDSNLAARGLSGSPVAAALMAKMNSDRIAQSVEFQNQIPLLDRQLTSEDLAALSGIVSAAPYGQTSTQTNKSTGTNTQYGSTGTGLEQGISSGASIAALLSKYNPKGW
jgi:hypothetical protein